MTTTLIAPCGLDCANCDAYKLTQANDQAGLEALLAKWKVDFSAPDMTLKDVTCDGCMATSGRLCGYCSMCAIRQCAVERGFATCAECGDYGCEKLMVIWQNGPQAKANLDSLRAKL